MSVRRVEWVAALLHSAHSLWALTDGPLLWVQCSGWRSAISCHLLPIKTWIQNTPLKQQRGNETKKTQRRLCYMKGTCNDDPATSTASDSASRSCTNWTVALLTVSPKNVTSGFSIPPQSSQEGTLKWRTCSSSRNTSPSGATMPAWAFQSGFNARKLFCSSSLAETAPQPRQTTLWTQSIVHLHLNRF